MNMVRVESVSQRNRERGERRRFVEVFELGTEREGTGLSLARFELSTDAARRAGCAGPTSGAGRTGRSGGAIISVRAIGAIGSVTSGFASGPGGSCGASRTGRSCGTLFAGELLRDLLHFLLLRAVEAGGSESGAREGGHQGNHGDHEARRT